MHLCLIQYNKLAKINAHAKLHNNNATSHIKMMKAGKIVQQGHCNFFLLRKNCYDIAGPGIIFELVLVCFIKQPIILAGTHI